MLQERAKVKEAELEAEQLAARSSKQQRQAEADGAEIAQLRHERQQQQEAVNRCVCGARSDAPRCLHVWCVCVCVCVCVCAGCSMR